jgi:hypothetical protein
MTLARVNAPCVSIYLPTHRHGVGTRSDAHHLNSILNVASKQLRERGVSASVAETTLNPIRALASHSSFWQHQSESLVMFASPVFWMHYSLPLPVKEQLVVNDIFYLRQLVPFLSGNGSFFILSLSQNSVRLFAANQYSIKEIISPDIPDSMDEALWFEMPQRELQFRSGGSGTVMFHGHGMGDELDKEAISRFFHLVDRAIIPLLHESTAPLVLAGVDYYIPLYKSVSHYSNIADGFVEGSAENKTPQQIHEVAWEVVKEGFSAPRIRKLEQFHNAEGTGLTIDSLPDILEAATEGRVDSIFITNTYHPVDEVNEALLNTAIKRAMTSGAEVFETEELPAATSPVSALLRY